VEEKQNELKLMEGLDLLDAENGIGGNIYVS
jgi:hypothetical protein